jgi:hypothetical protein
MTKKETTGQDIEGAAELQIPQTSNTVEPPYSIFPKWKKVFYV